MATLAKEKARLYSRDYFEADKEDNFSLVNLL